MSYSGFSKSHVFAASPQASQRKMALPIFGGITVFGGPYPEKPAGMFGVNLAAEIALPSEIALPIRNYGAPTQAALQEGIAQAIERLAKGEILYAGCKFGYGRTGLFMACLAKACGIANPIEWTRSLYHPKAVESEEQVEFVQNFDASALTQRLRELHAFPEPERSAAQKSPPM